MVGLGEKYEPRTSYRVHTTAGTSSDCTPCARDKMSKSSKNPQKELIVVHSKSFLRRSLFLIIERYSFSILAEFNPMLITCLLHESKLRANLHNVQTTPGKNSLLRNISSPKTQYTPLPKHREHDQLLLLNLSLACSSCGVISDFVTFSIKHIVRWKRWQNRVCLVAQSLNLFRTDSQGK